MDYKKKYLKYKLKYLTAKKLYGGMDAETLRTRVDKIATDRAQKDHKDAQKEVDERWKKMSFEERTVLFAKMSPEKQEALLAKMSPEEQEALLNYKYIKPLKITNML